MSLNKAKVLSCSLFIIGGILINGCESITVTEIETPQEVDNYNYKENYNNKIKIKTDFKSAGNKYEVNVY